MNKKSVISLLVIFLVSCSTTIQNATNSDPNLDQGLLIQDQADPTDTSNVLPADEGDGLPIGENPPAQNTSSADWSLTATFRYENAKDKTDITYTYEGLFNVKANGEIENVGISLGRGEGVGGVNYNGECLETQPVIVEFAYVIKGKVIDLALNDVEDIYDDLNPEVIKDGKARLFELSLGDASVALVSVSQFVKCAPDMDQSFLDSLATFWLDVIPYLPPEFRRVPAAAGIYCPGVFSFESGGLDKITVCYDLKGP